MNSKSFYYTILLLSVATVVALWLMTNSLGVVFLVCGILLVWMLIEKHSRKKNDEYHLLVYRVEKLKTFSYDLQQLIDNELALVQEDVLRTRNIVSDSIDLLQAASLSIHATVVLQDGEMRAFATDAGQVAQKSQVNNQMSVAQPETSGSNAVNIKAIVDNNSLMKLNAEKIMQALQFEDIVNQVSERVAQHIGDIQQTVNILSNLCNSELSSTFDEDLQRMNEEYQSVKEKLVNISSKKIASQEDMSEGDIDLF